MSYIGFLVKCIPNTQQNKFKNKREDKMKEQKTKKVIKKVKKSGVVKLKPKIVSEVKKDRSLIADHIAEATGKAKAVEKNIFVRAYIYVGTRWNRFIKNMFGM